MAPLLAFLLALHASFAAAADYGYIPGTDIGCDKWGDLSPEWALCGEAGTTQSPIDIPLYQQNFPLGPLNFDYPVTNSRPAIVVLDQHNVKLELDANWGTLEINNVKYYPENIHFHTPSEHTVGGTSYPLEMHIVHKTVDGQGIAVIGVLFEEGAEDNKFLNQIFPLFHKFDKDPEARIQIASLSAQELGISLDSGYWRYSGSLTTPPCTEGVTWTIVKEIATISEFQLTWYKKYRPAPDARPVQPLNNRRVTSFDLKSLCASGLELPSSRVNNM